jgi:hypothetical protein
MLIDEVGDWSKELIEDVGVNWDADEKRGIEKEEKQSIH